MSATVAIFKPPSPKSDFSRFSLHRFGPQTLPLEGARGFFYIREDTDGHFLTEPTRRALKKLAKFQTFFDTADFTVGRAVFCETHLFKASASLVRDHRDTDVFSEMKLGGNHYFIFSRGVGKKGQRSIHNFSKVTFLNVICLFGHQALKVYADDGSIIDLVHPKSNVMQRVARFELDPRPSMYEIDTAIRQSRLTFDLIAHMPPGVSYQISAEIPRVHYYCYMLDALQQQKLTIEQFFEWKDMVDTRHDQVTALLQRHYDYWLDTPSRVENTIGLDPVHDTIVAYAKKGKAPSLELLMDELASQDHYWALVKEVDSPTNFHDLQNLASSVELLRRALKPKDSPAELEFVVENHIERKTYRVAEILAEKIIARHSEFAFRALGFYPLELVFATAKPGDRPSMFWGDPGHAFQDSDGQNWTSVKLLKKLYALPDNYFSEADLGIL